MSYRYQVSKSIVVLLLISVLVSGANPYRPARRAAKTPASPDVTSRSPQPTQTEGKPQRIFAPHWTTEGSLYTTVFVRNTHLEQVAGVTVSLVLPQRTIRLPETRLDAQQTVAIDVERALLENGEKVEQAGAAFIDVEDGATGSISAYAQVLDVSNSLSFSFPFMQGGASDATPLDAVAWYFSPRTDAFIALQNTTDAVVIATPAVQFSGNWVNLGKRRLQAHEAVTLQLPRFPSKTPSGQQALAVRVAHNSQPGSVVAQGWVEDAAIGFSAPFTFQPNLTCDCGNETHHLYGTGMEIGSAGGMMGLAPGATFSPYLALRNRYTKSLVVNASFTYESAGQVETVALPPVPLGGQASALVNLKDYQDQGLIPASVPHGSIDLQYTGKPGALLAELTSVDQNGSFVSPVPLTCRGNRAANMPFWRTDGDWHSSVTLRNIAAEDNEVEITVSYPGGVYEVRKTLSAGGTAMVSVNDLQQSQEPDSAGRRIPLDATVGGVSVWSPLVREGLIVNAMLVNPVSKTCGSCQQYGYVTAACLVEDYALTTVCEFEPHAANDSFPLKIILRYNSGHTDQDGVNTSTVSSANPPVADYSIGQMHCLAGGNTYITARTSRQWPIDVRCSIYQTFLGNGLLNVIEAKIKQDNNDITGTTHDVIVGQKISLSVEVLPAGTSTTNNQWTIPEKKIANYVVNYDDADRDHSTATVTPLSNPTSTSVTFYWVDGGDGRQVKFSFKVLGKSFNAKATFNVKRPTVTFTSTSVSNVANDFACNTFRELHYGCTNPPRGLGPAGVTFAVANLSIPSGFMGTTELVQVVNSITRTKLKTTTQQLTLSGMGLLDTSFPYGLLYDSPSQPFALDDLQVTVSDSFSMYLIFKSSLPDSIWVPLKKINWSWGGDALQSGTLTSSSHSGNQVGTDATDPPTWTANATSLQFH
jgi:hypothetical protein